MVLSFDQLLQQVALFGRPPLTCHSLKTGSEMSIRQPNTDASEPLLELTRPHQYKAIRQRGECPLFFSTFIEDKRILTEDCPV